MWIGRQNLLMVIRLIAGPHATTRLLMEVPAGFLSCGLDLVQGAIRSGVVAPRIFVQSQTLGPRDRDVLVCITVRCVGHTVLAQMKP